MFDPLGNTKVVLMAAYASTATTDITGATIDMSGWESIMCIARVTTAAADTYLKWQQDTDSGMGTAADLAGSKVTSGTSETMVGCLVKPKERYVRAVVVRTTTTVFESGHYILFGGAKLPITSTVSGTTVVGTVVSPDEGTP